MKIIGYSDKISVAQGEAIRFMVSSEGPKSYRADVVRIICGDQNPAGPGYKEELVKTSVSGTYKGLKQAVHCGSYAIVPRHPMLAGLTSFSVQAMIWPTTPDRGEQVVIAKWSERRASGFQLMIDALGAVALRLGDGSGTVETLSAARPLIEREWAFAGASFDSNTGRAAVYQEPLVHYPTVESAATAHKTMKLRAVGRGQGPLVMAARIAAVRKGRLPTAAHYNGKIDSPRLADRALARAEMSAMMNAAIPPRLRPSLVAAWDFSRQIASHRIVDVSGNRLHGETVNLPTRGMTGFNWSGREMTWTAAPQEYGAIHFHDDDLYDCGWEPDFELTIPQSMRSGAYAVRLRAGPNEDYIPFFVRPRRGRPTAKVAYLAPTATYSAYANNVFALSGSAAEMMTDRLLVVQPWELYLDSHPELGASLYDHHSDGSGTCYSSRLRPVVNMRPKITLSAPPGDSSLYWYNADTHLTDWLEAKGIAFDVITDEDLDQEGVALLRPYRAVLTGTHPEYTSAAMWEAIKSYTEGGGRLMYMGGNGFYWRIAYHPELPGVIEVRRAEGGVRTWQAEPGEYSQSFDGEPGGLWRNLGRAPQRLAGSGMFALGFDRCSHYRRTPDSFDPRVAFAFEGIGGDELIGDFGLIGGGAAGLEIDIADRSLGTPPHALVVAASDGHSDNYVLATEEHTFLSDITGTMNPRIRAELVFLETANGGAVFAFSSIAWCASLAWSNYDNNVSRLTENVLNRFASDQPF